MATKKKSSSGSDPKSKRIVQKKVKTVMQEFKKSDLKSSSGEKVKNPKQAIAIALSEARHSGADIPPSPNAPPKKATKKKTVQKKSR